VLAEGPGPILIGDTKYKKLGAGDHKHADLYQMLSYCTAMDVRSGVLIYPRHGIGREQHLAIRQSPIRIRETSVDLSGRIVDIEREIDHLAQRLRDWSDRRNTGQRSDTGQRAFA
jgi:5-methylcytosine-specific restriction enzyme subunit McrC